MFKKCKQESVRRNSPLKSAQSAIRQLADQKSKPRAKFKNNK